MDRRLVDITLGAAVVFSTFALTGIGTVELFSYNLKDTAFVLTQGVAVNYHHLLTAAAMAIAWGIAQPSWKRLSTTKQTLVAASVVMMGASVIVPEQFGNVFNGTAMQIIGVTISTGGYWGIYS